MLLFAEISTKIDKLESDYKNFGIDMETNIIGLIIFNVEASNIASDTIIIKNILTGIHLESCQAEISVHG